MKLDVLYKKKIFEVLTSRYNLHFIGIKDFGTKPEFPTKAKLCIIMLKRYTF